MKTALRSIARLNLSAACFSLSAIGLGHALQIANGFYNPSALTWLSVALVLAVGGMFLQPVRTVPSPAGDIVIVALMACGIAWQIHAVFTARPGFYILPHASMTLFKGLVAMQGAGVVLGLSQLRAFRRIWFPGVLVASLGLGIWMIKASPDPYIDVVEVHREAIEALVHHKDPYRISMANIYEIYDSRTFYNQAAVIGNRVAQAYPYPPASLLLAVPGQVLFGDYRYSEIGLLVLAAALMGFSRRGMVGKIAACLLLTTPRIWFVIEQGWSEPIAIFVLALTVFLLVRTPMGAGWTAGVLVVTKQYLGFTGLALVRLVFLDRRHWFWAALGASIAAAAVTLPLALWHPNAFIRNVVTLQTLEPFRPDSLSYLSWAGRHGLGQGTYVWAIGAAVAGAVLSLVATRNTPEGFATSVALTTFIMFAFGSKAFCNYYFFVIGALCCILAVLPGAKEQTIVSGG